MKSGECPKCSSRNVYDGSKVPFKRGFYAQNTMKIANTAAAALDRYVCGDCGYVENYVGSSRALQKIAGTWPKVDSG